ncbi:SRA-YDG domain-containing protein [Nocardioides marmoriginsengisoli]|uniref:SRA-YDG domain-containing protein n=1 Tax=Nocardioides marmoriginsengisoli TaxID=661483 RepID=A0A3N0CQU0_9ACTN|nr:YDG/SRA domain-containing protein [Nocardioides marmoriginsengisoli]RNL65396.1 SRA-YDG domain-containing protein [Nocardioides marmoriginsengisoli]
MAEYVRGEIPGQPVGTTYLNRRDAADKKVHQVTVQGIAGNTEVGAVSIVINGGYVDDEDHGHYVIYTGAGGNDPGTKRQIADQSLTYMSNAALVVSQENGYPIRVLRGAKGDHPDSPTTGLRYDGLFQVTDHWSEPGKDGFLIWRFRLDQIDTQTATTFAPGVDPTAETPPPGVSAPSRTSGVVVRVVRSTAVSDWVKKIHKNTCQICGIRLTLAGGAYSEGAHVRALGAPHNGPDTADNLLCLCPNDHVLFDQGAIYIEDDLTVRSHTGAALGTLTTNTGHSIDVAHLKQHRNRFGFP